MGEAGLKLFLFQEEDGERIALTEDRSGSMLPQLGIVWRAREAVDLREFRPASMETEPREICEAVMRDGYFMWPPVETH